MTPLLETVVENIRARWRDYRRRDEELVPQFERLWRTAHEEFGSGRTPRQPAAHTQVAREQA